MLMSQAFPLQISLLTPVEVSLVDSAEGFDKKFKLGLTIFLFVLLYVQHVYIFQPDDFIGIDVVTMRRKSLIWKFFLTFLMISLSCLFPIRDPILFVLLSNEEQYQR